MKFTKEPLERFIFVSQSGGNNAKVKSCVHGIESVYMLSLFNGSIPLTQKGIVHVFRESDKEWVGYIKRSDTGLPTAHLANEQGLHFDDFYTQA